MRRKLVLAWWLGGVLLALGVAFVKSGFAAEQPVRVLIVTGGHGFERAEFFAAFDAMPGIAWKEAQHPNANRLYAQEAARSYDVLVLYDMVQDITEDQKEDLVRLLKEQGTGLVSLHHSIIDYYAWPEFANIIGGRYYLEDTDVNGQIRARSTFEHDQRFTVQIVDSNHPVTRGLKDFEIEDETYHGYDVYPGVTELLRVDHPKSAPVIGWAKEYGRAKVVYIQLGHGPTAFENENFRTIVRNAILYTAGRHEPAH
jgi:hypothetical protein